LAGELVFLLDANPDQVFFLAIVDHGKAARLTVRRFHPHVLFEFGEHFTLAGCSLLPQRSPG
jgi:hypothetical protein